MTSAISVSPCTIDPGSFRDRTARVFHAEGAVYRGLTAVALEEWETVSATRFFAEAVTAGRIVATETVASSTLDRFDLPTTEWRAVLRHQKIPFVSYPYEWCFGMLKDAALLQLELVADALSYDIALKDATPFNIQWTGAAPIFIDVASFVRRRAGEPWTGYRQFCRMFLYPLLLQAYKGVGFHAWLRGRLDGIESHECRRFMSWRDLMRPGVFTHVVAQSHLEKRYGPTSRDIKKELREAGFDQRIIANAVTGLENLVRGLDWASPSAWSQYVSDNSYDEGDSIAKECFVETVVRGKPRRLVWDLGCNTGRFAKIAANHADYVIAVDSDHESVERLYREIRREGRRNILPLVADVADPSPALGWRGKERVPMADRGRPDVVLCLALVHHLAITSNIPIADLLDWLAELGADLVIEFPTPDDVMVKRLLLNKEQQYRDYSLEYFEASLHRRFHVHDRLVLASGTRVLYHATPIAAD